MVSKISQENGLSPYPIPYSEIQKDVSLENIMIPLILCLNNSPANGKEILFFKNAADLTKNELSMLDRKTLCLAKLIIVNDKHVIKLGTDANDLNFDEINYRFIHEGKEISGAHKKGDQSIEVMDGIESKEIQAIFSKTIAAFEEEEAFSQKERSEEGNSSKNSPSKNFSNNNSSPPSFILSPFFDRTSLKKRQKALEAEKKEQEKEAVREEKVKRDYKNKEELWHQRQKHFEIKDQNLKCILENALHLGF